MHSGLKYRAEWRSEEKDAYFAIEGKAIPQKFFALSSLSTNSMA